MCVLIGDCDCVVVSDGGRDGCDVCASDWGRSHGTTDREATARTATGHRRYVIIRDAETGCLQRERHGLCDFLCVLVGIVVCSRPFVLNV